MPTSSGLQRVRDEVPRDLRDPVLIGQRARRGQLEVEIHALLPEAGPELRSHCVPAGFTDGRSDDMVRELGDLFELTRK